MLFTNIKDLKYSKADKSTIDLLCTCKEYGEIPMTLNLIDTEDLHVFASGKFEVVLENEVKVEKEILIPLEEYCKTLEISTYVEPETVIIIPQSITPLQAKLQLLKLGLLDEVEELVTGDRTAQLYWEYASVIERDNAVLLLIANSMGLTSEQVDEMFIEASKL